MEISDIYNALCKDCRQKYRDGKINCICDLCDDDKYKFKSAWEYYMKSVTNGK